MNVIWTEEEKQFIKLNASTMTDEGMAAQLSKLSGREVSLQAARKQRQKLDIKKCHGRGVCKLAEAVSPKPLLKRGVNNAT